VALVEHDLEGVGPLAEVAGGQQFQAVTGHRQNLMLTLLSWV
jgi:hypothetical protein